VVVFLNCRPLLVQQSDFNLDCHYIFLPPKTYACYFYLFLITKKRIKLEFRNQTNNYNMSYQIADGFPYYIQQTIGQDFMSLFQNPAQIELYKNLSEAQSQYRYATGKWSIKQILGHITDHERIMTYRALRFSRADSTTLSGYDQDVMVNGARFDQLPWALLIEDYQNVRKATLSFIACLSAGQLLLTGQAWKYNLSVEDFLRATIGHELHHVQVLKDRYLPGVALIS
jgi:hypothetical protein